MAFNVLSVDKFTPT